MSDRRRFLKGLTSPLLATGEWPRTSDPVFINGWGFSLFFGNFEEIHPF